MCRSQRSRASGFTLNGGVPHPQPRMPTLLGVGGRAAPVLLQEHGQPLARGSEVLLGVHRAAAPGRRRRRGRTRRPAGRTACVHAHRGVEGVGSHADHPHMLLRGPGPPAPAALRARSRERRRRDDASASPARRRHSSYVVAPSTAATSASARGVIDSDVTPSPTSTAASGRRPPPRRTTPTGRPCAAHRRRPRRRGAARRAARGRTGAATEPSRRSAAIVYWHEVVGADADEVACARIGRPERRGRHLDHHAGASSPWSRSRGDEPAASSTVETIGAMTQTSAVSAAAAGAIAVSWSSRICGCAPRCAGRARRAPG